MTTLTTRYRFSYFIRFFGDALFYPFFSLYLVSIGIEGQQLGFVLGLIPLMTVIGNPLWGMLTKNPSTHRKIMQGLAISVGIALIGFTLTDRLPLIIALTLLLGVSDSTALSLWDGWVSKHAAEVGKPYATIRIFGSLSYVISTSIAGIIIMYFGYATSFQVGALFYFAFFFLVRRLPQPTVSISKGSSESDFKRLFANKSYLIYLLAFLFAVTSAGVADGLLTIMLESKGLPEMYVGYLWSLIVIVEIFIMMFLSHRKMIHQEKLWLFFSITGHVLRYALYAMDLSLELTIIATLLRGFSWGIIVYSHIQVLQATVDARDLSLSIMMINVFSSIYAFIMNPIAGYLYKNQGFPLMFLIFAILEIVGGVILVFVKPKREINGMM